MVNVTIDVNPTVGANWEALECHPTQFGAANLFRRLPDETMKRLMSREYFMFAWSEPAPGEVRCACLRVNRGCAPGSRKHNLPETIADRNCVKQLIVSAGKDHEPKPE